MERAHTTVLLKMQIDELTAAIDKCREVGAYLTDGSRLYKGPFPWELDYTRYQCDELEGFYSKWMHSDTGWGHDEVVKNEAPSSSAQDTEGVEVRWGLSASFAK
eukprot:3455031-Pyramimonas_sp.AAC.1